MKARYLLMLLPVLFSVSARAELWDLIFTGPAAFGGLMGAEKVRYRYDTDDVVYVRCNIVTPCTTPDPNDPFWPYGPTFNHEYTYGPIHSMHWSGMVNGAGGPTEFRTSLDLENGEGQPAYFGHTFFPLYGPFPAQIGLMKNPSETVIAQLGLFEVTGWYTMFGGEDGWTWDFSGVPYTGPIVTVSFERVSLPEPGSLALLAAVVAGIAITGRRRLF